MTRIDSRCDAPSRSESPLPQFGRGRLRAFLQNDDVSCRTLLRGCAMKRFRFLWWTYTVRGRDYDFVEVESRFGLRTVYSLGRWVLSNLVAIIVLTGSLVPFAIIWRDTGDPLAAIPVVMFAILDVTILAMLVWTLAPSRKST